MNVTQKYVCKRCNQEFATEGSITDHCNFCRDEAETSPKRIDSLVKGILDGKVMTCLGAPERLALKRQFAKEWLAIEELEKENERLRAAINEAVDAFDKQSPLPKTSLGFRVKMNNLRALSKDTR